MTLVVGITGGIGAGKSTLTERLIKKGYFVLLQHSFSKNIFIKENQKIYMNWEDAVNNFIIFNN